MKGAFLVSPFKSAKLLNKKDAQMLVSITETTCSFQMLIYEIKSFEYKIILNIKISLSIRAYILASYLIISRFEYVGFFVKKSKLQ